MSNINNILYKNIDVLKKQVEEQEQTIKQLRLDISKLKQYECPSSC